MDETNANIADNAGYRDQWEQKAQKAEFKGKFEKSRKYRGYASKFDIEVKALEAKNKAIEEQVRQIIDEAERKGVKVKAIDIERTINTMPISEQIEWERLGMYSYVADHGQKVRSKEYLTKVQ
jgi:hypothetical protein